MNELERIMRSILGTRLEVGRLVYPFPGMVESGAQALGVNSGYLSPEQQRQLPSVPRSVSPTPEQRANEAVEDVRAQTRAIEQRAAAQPAPRPATPPQVPYTAEEIRRVIRYMRAHSR